MGDRGDQRLAAQQHQQQRPGEAMKGLLPLPEKAPSASQALTVVTLFPAGGLLLVLSGLALAASVVGVVVAAPVFLLFSPVLVPAALLLALAVAGFLASGALGLGGLSSLSWLADTLRAMFQKTPDYVDQAKRRMADAAAHAGQRTKDAGQTVQTKAHESAGKT
ncbi:Oleosin 5 [Ananas comosus]|uniref:Oleosin 5 n=1 Tax=Ananas comosus TaxID=4615 RepID=A0A199W2I6_ANACO|nr:Oleosin 5 [Ananas comosus]